MPPDRHGKIPLEALRDLLGVVRALFSAWTASRMGPIELEELRGIGQALAAAYKMAKGTEPNTIGHRAAWSRAEAATARLGHLVGALEPLRPTVTAAAKRVVGAPAVLTAQSEREAKKKHARMRG
jgi:hypothetical protein